MNDADVELSGHIVICNWTPRANRLIRELHAPVVPVKRPIVIVTPEVINGPQSEDPAFDRVFFIPGDPTTDQALQRANVAKAYAAIILADPKQGEHADARSILIALAIENIEPAVHTCVELLSADNRYHFRHTQVDEIICVDELANQVVAHSCLTPGLSELYMQLLTSTECTNEIYIVPLSEGLVGASFREAAQRIDAQTVAEVVVLGMVVSHGPERRTIVNPRQQPEEDTPGRDHRLAAGDELIVMAYARPNLTQLLA